MKKILLFLLFAVISYYSHAQQCNTPLRIVVLGSSTAWGNGVPSRDSAWTFRYLRYLKANHAAGDTVIILAKGGNTTHTIQATGTPAYTVSGITFQVDTTCNISRAFSLNPSAIIVNIPNEDEARNFPLNIQVANLLAIKQLAASHHVPLWVATTQPRNNLGYASGTRLLQMKDSIISYFGTHAIDFMTDLADNKGYILPAYNSGDDALLNASGQKILFDKVVAKQLPQTLCSTSQCNKALKVVVLGSSTAWGNGLPNRDSAWTQQYARYLKQYHNDADTLILKAIGSSTTQNMMPSGTPGYTVPATGLTYNVDTSSNITKAISYQPDFIIINMPSNDEARSFPLSKQVENFRVLKQVAADNNIPLWVTTSQPRSNLGYAAAQRLAQLKDSINLIFGDKAIDFWSGLGYPNGYIDSIYNSGDDVHFNATGQRILFERVVAKNIPAVLCGSSARSAAPVTTMPVTNRVGDNAATVVAPVLKLYPNPATSFVNIPAFCETPYLLEVYNNAGVRCFQDKRSGSAQILVNSWPAGIYYILITHGTVRERLRFVKL